MAASDDDTQRQLGILIGQMAGVARQLAGIEQRQDRSDESRKGLHGRMDGIAADLGEIKNDSQAQSIALESVRKDVKAMQPEIELVRGIRQKAAWTATLFVGLGGLATWLVSNFWEPIRDWLATRFH